MNPRTSRRPLRQPLTRLALAAATACAAAQSAWAVSEPTVPAGAGQAVVTGSSTVVRPVGNPLQLGWHLIARSFQGGYSSDQGNLWNPTEWPDATYHTQSLNPELLSFLARDFEGSFYRYGGNTFDWPSTVGASRPTTQKDELGNMPVLFGPDEFLRFVERVKGVPVLIPNIASKINQSEGGYDFIDPNLDAGHWSVALANARAFFEYVNGCAAPGGSGYVAECDLNGDNTLQGNLRYQNGHPEPYRVRYWELGNELDRVPNWNADVYALRAQALAQQLRADWAVGQNYLKGSLVILGHSFTTQCAFKADNCTPTSGTEPTASPSNVPGNTNYSPQTYWLKKLWNTTGTQLDGFATHQYYERVWHVLARQDYFNYALGYWAGQGGYSARPIYVTEHALYPGDAQNKNNWPQTTAIDQSSAGTLGLFDFLAGAAQRPHVRMAVRHDLAAVGPWAAFSPLVPGSGSGNYNYAETKEFVPRPLAWASKLAHRALRGVEVLDTAVTTNNTSGTDYDVRAAAYRVPNSSVRGAFLAHRGTADATLQLGLPSWTSGSWVTRLNGVGGGADDTRRTRLWKRYASIDVGSNQASLALPALSVLDVRALGPNLIANGDFESGTTGWGGSSGCYVWNDHTPVNATDGDAIHGTKVLRTNHWNGAVSCEVSQTSSSNAELGSSGTIATYPSDTYVLRANVRRAPVSGSVPDFNLGEAVRLRAELKSGSTTWALDTLAEHNVFLRTADYQDDAGSKWEPVEIEFVPSNVLGVKTLSSLAVSVYHDVPSTGAVDIDGVTLLRRPNLALVPKLAGTSALSTSWETRVPSGTGNSATYFAATSTERAFVRLRKNSGSYGVQLVQSNTANTALSSGQLFDTARNDRWRLRAYVRAWGSGLAADAARLKVQVFDSAGGYLEASPVGEPGKGTISGTDTSWREVTLDFIPAQVIGNSSFGRAEIGVELVGNAASGGVEVSFVGLERVLD